MEINSPRQFEQIKSRKRNRDEAVPPRSVMPRQKESEGATGTSLLGALSEDLVVDALTQLPPEPLPAVRDLLRNNDDVANGGCFATDLMSVSRQRCSSSWEDLIPDLLITIADSLDVASAIRLSAMCTSWYSTIRPLYPSLPPISIDQPTPWLLLSAQSLKNKPCCTELTFYDLSSATNFSVPISIPSLCGHRWLGSYKGWLVILDQQHQLHIIKPLTGTHALLPSVESLGEGQQPKKVILCHTSDCTDELKAFCLTEQGNLAVAKVGDEAWTSIDYNWSFQDILLYQGRVYGISCCTVCCFNPRSFYMKPQTVLAVDAFSGWTKYLLEWKGQLMMLLIDKDEWIPLETHAPRRAQLYKLNIRDSRQPMNLVRSLGDDALFVGANCSYTLPTSGCDVIQGNHIYFTDQMGTSFLNPGQSSNAPKFGAFDLRNGTYMSCCPQGTPMHLPLPIWFWPL